MQAGSRWSLNKWVLSLFQKMPSDSTVLTLVGSSLHHWGAKTEKSCHCAEWSSTSRPADVVEQSRSGGMGRVVRPVFGGRWVQFHWQPWRPAPSPWIGCRLQQEADSGHGGGRMGEFGWIVNEASYSVLDRLRRFIHRGWESSQEWDAVVQAGDSTSTRSFFALFMRKDRILRIL